MAEADDDAMTAAELEASGEFDDLDVTAIEREERQASRRSSSIEAGRRKGGVAGAAMAGAMLAIQEIYQGPLKEDVVVEVEASGEPGDIDSDGIEVTVGDVDMWAPPPDGRGPSDSA